MKNTINPGTNILSDNWSFQVIADFLSFKCDPSMEWGWIATNQNGVFNGTIKSGVFQIECLVSLLEQILFTNRIYVMKGWIPLWYKKGTDLDLLYNESQNGIVTYLPNPNKQIENEREIWVNDILPNEKIKEKFSLGMEKYRNGGEDFWSQVLNGIAEYLAFSSSNNLTYSPHPTRSGYLKSTVWGIPNGQKYPTSGINKFNQIIDNKRVSLGNNIGYDNILTKLNTKIPSAALLCIADSSPTSSPISVALQMRNNDEIKNLRQILHHLTIAIGKTENGITSALEEVNYYVNAFETASQEAENILKIPVSLGGENKPGYIDLEYLNYEKYKGESIIKGTDIIKHTGIISRLINTGSNHTRKILETKLKIRDSIVYNQLMNWHSSDFFQTMENKQNVTLYKIVMEEHNYINKGNVGIMGPDGKIINSKIEQTNTVNEEGKSDIQFIAQELSELIKKLKEEATNPEQFRQCTIVAEAQEAANKGDKSKTIEILKKSGKWVFDTATQIGIRLTAAILNETILK